MKGNGSKKTMLMALLIPHLISSSHFFVGMQWCRGKTELP